MTMAINPFQKRRDFLKTAAAGAAGAVGLGALRIDRVFAQTTGGWVDGMQINPAIDNKRVICCHDTTMLTTTPANTSFTSQNAAVDAAKVAANLDEMAMQLAQKTTAADAWSTIFRSSKPWASTKVAIKANAILGTNGNHPRVAIIKKICDVFVDQFKVPAANIILYDANSDASSCYSTYASLTDATKIRATVSKYGQSLGGMKAVTIASADRNISAVGDFVDGVTDILVDIAVVKVHSGPGTSYSFGSCSLCMKNHLGTFINNGTDANPSSTGLHTLNAILEINKHPAILGGNPVRQQLCIVDSLLANGNGAGGSFDTRVDRIVMGTFAPTVDYCTATNIMTTVMNKPDRNNNLSKFITSFGYAATEVLDWNEYVPGSAPPINPKDGGAGSGGSSGTGGAGSGGNSGTGGAGSSGTGGAGSGGSSGVGGSGSGGKSGTGGSGRGGASASGGANSGGTSATGGANSGGTSALGGANSGGSSASGGAGSGGAGSGGAVGTGGTPSNGGTAGGAFGGTAGASTGLGGSTATGAKGSSGGCNVALGGRGTVRWGMTLAIGALVAGKLRNLFARQHTQSDEQPVEAGIDETKNKSSE
jgi:hypothetical protein